MLRVVRDETSSDATKSIRVVVVDDHPVLANGLANALDAQTDISVIGVARDIAQALFVIDQTAPDVVLIDDELPDGDGVELASQVRRRWPAISVVMLVSDTDGLVSTRAYGLGCAGVIEKRRGLSDVISIVRSIPRAVVRSGRARQNFAQHYRSHRLTERETDILRLLARCHTPNEIAGSLYLSVHTVRNHIQNIFTKLGAHSKLEAVTIAVRDEIVPLEMVR